MTYVSSAAQLDQAQAALEDGNIDQAMAYYQDIIAAGGPQKASALFGLASCYARRKEWGEAENALDEVILYAPDFATGYAYRGAVYLELARPDEAMRDLEYAVKLAPKEAIIHVKRAEVFMRLGLIPAAHDAVRRAAKLPAPDVAVRDYIRAFLLGVEKELKRSIPRENPPINWGWLHRPRWLRRASSVAPSSLSR
ncbi:MAG: tetratricopeptide repeat protein [Ktedonobacterales bacterium]|nr:tetratricopeptide repeat protein [Ktedonobacterales bacterium]